MRVPSASASYGRGRFATFFRPWPASHAAPAAANAFAAARRRPSSASTAAAAPAAQIEPSSVTPVKNRSASGPWSRFTSAEELGVDLAALGVASDQRPTATATPDERRSEDDVPQLHAGR